MTTTTKKGSKKKNVVGYMSADELKEGLYNHFREIGAFDNLQAQLRSKLATEMFKSASPLKQPDESEQKISATSTLLLPLQVCNWLVYDHLKRNKYDYSLSTFISEAQLNYPKKLLSLKDILKLIGINESTAEHELINKSYFTATHESFLFTFLSTCAKHSTCNHTSESNRENQTTFKYKTESVFHDDFSKPSPLHLKHPSNVFREIFSQDVISSRSPLLDADGNQILQQRLQLEREKHEREVLNLRQKLMQELDKLHTQEYKTRLGIEQQTNKLIMEQELLDVEKEKMKMKEFELKMRAESIDKEVEEKLKLLQMNQLPPSEKTEFENWEVKLKSQQQWLESEISKLKSQSQELENTKVKLRQLEESYRILQSKHSTVLMENANLQRKLSENTVTQEELSWKTKQFENYERELLQLKFEMQEEKSASIDTIRRLQQQLMENLPKQLYQQQRERFSNNPMSSFSWNLEKQKLEDECSDTKKLCHAVLQRMQEQKNDIQELHRLIHNLYYHVSQNKGMDISASGNKPADQGNNIFVSNNVSNPFERSIPSHASPDIQQHGFMNVKKQNSENTGVNNEAHLKFIADAKKRIVNLEKESKELEQKYTTLLTSGPLLLPNIYVPFSGSTFSKITSDFESFVPNPRCDAKKFIAADFASGCDAKHRVPSLLRENINFSDIDGKEHLGNFGVYGPFANTVLNSVHVPVVANSASVLKLGDNISVQPKSASSTSKHIFEGELFPSNILNEEEVNIEPLKFHKSLLPVAEKPNITPLTSNKEITIAEYSVPVKEPELNKTHAYITTNISNNELVNDPLLINVNYSPNPVSNIKDHITKSQENKIISAVIEDESTIINSELNKTAGKPNVEESYGSLTNALLIHNEKKGSLPSLILRKDDFTKLKILGENPAVTADDQAKIESRQREIEKMQSHGNSEETPSVPGINAATVQTDTPSYVVSPFRQRRRFSLSKKGDEPLVDLDAAWKEKSPDLLARATIVDNPVVTKQDGHIIGSDSNAQENRDLRPGSHSGEISVSFSNTGEITNILRKDEDSERNSDKTQQAHVKEMYDFKEDVITVQRAKDEVMGDKNEINLTSAANISLQNANVSVSEVKHGAPISNIRTVTTFPMELSGLGKENRGDSFEVPSIHSDKEVSKVNESDLPDVTSELELSAGELSELHVSAGSEHSTSKDETSDEW